MNDKYWRSEDDIVESFYNVKDRTGAQSHGKHVYKRLFVVYVFIGKAFRGAKFTAIHLKTMYGIFTVSNLESCVVPGDLMMSKMRLCSLGAQQGKWTVGQGMTSASGNGLQAKACFWLQSCHYVLHCFPIYSLSQFPLKSRDQAALYGP